MGATGHRRAEFEELARRETDDHVIWPGALARNGYGVIRIDKVARYVHRLALTRRQPPPDVTSLACHEPGRGCPRHCMNYRHLRWDSSTANHKDMLIDGTQPLGATHHNARLTAEQVRAIRALAVEGMTQRAIGERFGVDQRTVSKIVRRERWTHL